MRHWHVVVVAGTAVLGHGHAVAGAATVLAQGMTVWVMED